MAARAETGTQQDNTHKLQGVDRGNPQAIEHTEARVAGASRARNARDVRTMHYRISAFHYRKIDDTEDTWMGGMWHGATNAQSDGEGELDDKQAERYCWVNIRTMSSA